MLPVWFAGLLLLLVLPRLSHADEPLRLKLAIHLHSTVSTGELEPARIVELAKQAGLDGIVFTDSARRHWEYGLWPLRGLIKRVVTHPSVSTVGFHRYLHAIHRLNRAPEDVLAIPGIEAAPFYYWRRSPFDRRGGEIHNWHQHLLVLGLDDPVQFQTLPWTDFDPYGGDRGAAPYQRFIDAVKARGGLVFWAHPAAAHAQRIGSIEIYTAAYPHLLEATVRYDGFAVSDLQHVPLVEPGGLWDGLLTAFLEDRRERPAWIFGELDWHRPSERPLDAVVTVLRVAERAPEAVLAAMREGRMWAVFRHGALAAPTLTEFLITDLASQRTATIGESLQAHGPLRVRVQGTCGSESADGSRVTLVRNGHVRHTEDLTTSMFEVEWTEEKPATRSFYRVVFTCPAGLVYTNPIFVQGAP